MTRTLPPTSTVRSRSLPPFGLAWLALMLAVVVALRAWRISAALGGSAGCETCLATPTLAHDAWLLAPAWALLAVAAWSRRGWLRTLLALPALLLLGLMAMDVAILTTLGMRLYVFDVFKFGMEGSALSGFVMALLRSSGAIWLVLALLGLLASAMALLPQRRAPGLALALGIAAALAGVGGAVTRMLDPAYINADSFLNIVELHYAQDVNRPYSPEFMRALAVRPMQLPQTCSAGLQRRPDIIVLAVESLSSYQSALLGGPLDLTPELDAIARQNRWFTRFTANGFSTDAGLISLLTGRAPVPAIGRYRSMHAFAGFGDPERSVARPLHAAGYSVNFFTTGDLGFLDKAPWIKALGFDHWEGAEQPFYATWPRGGFNAAGDRALYLRLLDWMQQRDRKQPFFAIALTVQSHPPFVDPATHALDEPAVFTAVDREIGRFVRELDAAGFFANGMLLITGDHRSMTPLRREERMAFGDAAFARVPLVMVGPDWLPPGPVDAPFQQTDLLPSLADLTASESCHMPDQGRFLRPDPQPPAWTLHARGDARQRVDVAFAEGRGALLLRGDASEWVGDRPPQWQVIADRIHADRIQRGALDSDIGTLIGILGD